MLQVTCPGCQSQVSLSSENAALQVCGLCGSEYLLQPVLLKPGPMLPPGIVAAAATVQEEATVARGMVPGLDAGMEVTVVEPAGADAAREFIATETGLEIAAPTADAGAAGELPPGADGPQNLPPSNIESAETGGGATGSFPITIADDEEEEPLLATGAASAGYDASDVTGLEHAADTAERISVGEGSAEGQVAAAKFLDFSAVAAADMGRSADAGEYLSSMSVDSGEPTTVAATAKRRPKEPGMMAHMVGIVGGGFLGLAIGYYVLCLIDADRFNVFKLPLPGIKQPGTQGSSEK